MTKKCVFQNKWNEHKRRNLDWVDSRTFDRRNNKKFLISYAVYACSSAFFDRLQNLVEAFKKKFGCEPEFFGRAPGRVNLIGKALFVWQAKKRTNTKMLVSSVLLNTYMHICITTFNFI